MFRPTLRRAQLAWRCAAAITDNPLTSYQDALPKVGSPLHLHAAAGLPQRKSWETKPFKECVFWA